jgi:hypothetical protein
MSQVPPTPETTAGPEPVPVRIPSWEDPAQPRLTALVHTLWDVLSHPGKFFAAMPRQGCLGPLMFGLIVGSFSLLAGFYVELLLSLGLGQEMQSLPGVARFMEHSTRTIIALMILTPGLILVSLLAGSGCLWGVLRLMGVAADFAPVLRVNGYSQGALLAAIVPVLGSLAAISWNMYLTCKGVQNVFKLTSGRALVAVFLALAAEAFLFVVLVIGLGLLFLAPRLL